jgi:hypothetical protein
MKKIGFLGIGRYGRVLLEDILQCRTLSLRPEDVTICDTSAQLTEAVQARYSVKTTTDQRHLIAASDLLIVGIPGHSLAYSSVVTGFLQQITRANAPPVVFLDNFPASMFIEATYCSVLSCMFNASARWGLSPIALFRRTDGSGRAADTERFFANLTPYVITCQSQRQFAACRMLIGAGFLIEAAMRSRTMRFDGFPYAHNVEDMRTHLENVFTRCARQWNTGLDIDISRCVYHLVQGLEMYLARTHCTSDEVLRRESPRGGMTWRLMELLSHSFPLVDAMMHVFEEFLQLEAAHTVNTMASRLAKSLKGNLPLAATRRAAHVDSGLSLLCDFARSEPKAFRWMNAVRYNSDRSLFFGLGEKPGTPEYDVISMWQTHAAWYRAHIMSMEQAVRKTAVPLGTWVVTLGKRDHPCGFQASYSSWYALSIPHDFLAQLLDNANLMGQPTPDSVQSFLTNVRLEAADARKFLQGQLLWLGVDQWHDEDWHKFVRYWLWIACAYGHQTISDYIYFPSGMGATSTMSLTVGLRKWLGNDIVQAIEHCASLVFQPVNESMKREAEKKAAAAGIFARNKSHNIGSHVTPRSRLEDLRARVEELLLPIAKKDGMSEVALRRLEESLPLAKRNLAPIEAWKTLQEEGARTEWNQHYWEDLAFPIVRHLRDELDDYGQRKDEFVAEFSTDPLISTRGASFYREIILPFIQNTGLTDVLAANENFRYTWDSKPGIVVRCFVRASATDMPREIRPQFFPETTPAETWAARGGPLDYPPYGNRFAKNPGADITVDVPDDTVDPRIALPGPVGEMAFYGILENIIRNAAKHGHRGVAAVTALEIHVVLTPQDDEHYRVALYENLTGPEGKLESLRQEMQARIDQDIVGPSGECRKEAWGTAEMKLCADLLCGVAPGGRVADEKYALRATVIPKNAVETAFERPNRWPEPQSVLAYEFSIRKAWTAVFLGFPDANSIKSELKSRGFRFDKGRGLVANEYVELPPAFDFAVLHASLFEAREFDPKRLAWLHHLPFRVIVCGLSPDSQAYEPLRKAGVCHVAAIASFADLRKSLPNVDAAEPKETPNWDDLAERVTHWLWSNWLKNLRRKKRNGRPVVADLYFHQEGHVAPTKTWALHARAFNAAQAKPSELSLRVWAKKKGSDEVEIVGGNEKTQNEDSSRNSAPDNAPIRVVVDRHGGFVSDHASGAFQRGDCIIVIDKASSDFEALYNAGFGKPWQLPYELAEAGLLRVLILDERIAQSASRHYKVIEQARSEFRMAFTGSAEKAPTLRDVAERAGIRVALHLEFRHKNQPPESPKGWQLELATRNWTTLELAKAEAATPDPHRVVVEMDYAPGTDETGTATVPKIDKIAIHGRMCLVAVHQGIIDLIKEKYNGNTAESFVERLSAEHWVVIESGRGIPPEVQQSNEKFLSYSLIDRAFHGNRVAKLGLTRHLMTVTRNRKP